MDSQQVTIDIGGEKTVRVNADLFSLAGDNKFASMLSDRWHRRELQDDFKIFVDYSPKVFMPLIESHMQQDAASTGMFYTIPEH